MGIARAAAVASRRAEAIPERFPQLRLAFLEAGCGWAPYWMERMDDEYDKRGRAEAPALKKKPSDYVRSGTIYFSCEADEWLLPQALRLVGENQIVYASDFPHWDNSYPGSIDEIRTRGDISETQKRKVLADNGRRFVQAMNRPLTLPSPPVGERWKIGALAPVPPGPLTTEDP